MLDAIKLVKEIVPTARLDCCPFDNGVNGTGYFIRIGMNGHWLSKVRRHPRAAWAYAAHWLSKDEGDQSPVTGNLPI